ncbi:MAG: hypothetical protein Q8L55_00135 [Phycisphaerales bacterium]|nr:hypothetical protein [Phycisphaerales bacterium]
MWADHSHGAGVRGAARVRFAVPESAQQPVMTLAIETANPGSGGGSVALGLIGGGAPEVLAVEALVEVDRDRDDLVPAIERLMAATGRTLRDVGRVAASVGPGGFTSTRVACATAAMLAEGLGVPAVAVPSALVASERRRRVGGAVDGALAVLMASKGSAAWCAVVPAGGGAGGACAVDAARGGRMMTAPEIVASGVWHALADGHLPPDVRRALAEGGVTVEAISFCADDCLRASALCTPGDPSVLVPIYPREPEAVTLWRARHGPKR